MPRILSKVKTFMQKTFRTKPKKSKVTNAFKTDSDASDSEQTKELQAVKAVPAMEKVPKFITELTGTSITEEGDSAHFEAQIEPMDDPNLKVEVYHNGEPFVCTKKASINFNSGLFLLDIHHCVPTDAGEYSIITRNDYGSSVSSYRVEVKEKEHKEDFGYDRPETNKTDISRQSFERIPVFTQTLNDIDGISEGQTAHFRCQVMPGRDPNLIVEWFRNGKPIIDSYRITRCHSFGYATLKICQIRSDDEGKYACRASNAHGEATTEASINIIKNPWLMEGSFHPHALPLINALEELKRIGDRPDTVYDSPYFENQMQNIVCHEGSSVQFQCKVYPAKDPTLKVEYFSKGKPIPFGARFNGTCAFGVITITIDNCKPVDSGEYMVVASTNQGQCSTAAVLKCSQKSNINVQTQHPQGMEGLQKIKDIDDKANKISQHNVPKPTGFPVPQWTKILPSEITIEESQPLRLEATLAPKDDPNLKVEWSLNGKALKQGTRYNLTSEFGTVTLKLSETYERDQGIYTCRASNYIGQAFTSTSVYCNSKNNINIKTQHPKGKQGYEKIEKLERSLQKECQRIPPIFVKQFENIKFNEGETVRFDAILKPEDDHSMKVEWLHNGNVINPSHGINTTYAFGSVSLEIISATKEQSGTYTCQATNDLGQAEISAMLDCKENPGIDNSQTKSKVKVRNNLTIYSMNDNENQENFEQI